MNPLLKFQINLVFYFFYNIFINFIIKIIINIEDYYYQYDFLRKNLKIILINTLIIVIYSFY